MDKELLRTQIYNLFTDLRIDVVREKPGDVYEHYANAALELFDTYSTKWLDEKVTEVLGYYAEDVFTPPTDDDRDKFNELNPNAHTRIHCGGIRHGLHQLRRAARELTPREDLEVIRVSTPKEKTPPKEVLLGKIEHTKFILDNLDSLSDKDWLSERLVELEEELKQLEDK